jgi:alpha-amylase/alpha-mannosidase (GH57 family)
MNTLHCGDSLNKGAVKMPQRLRKFGGSDTNESNEELVDLDVSEITNWIDNSELHPVVVEYGILNMIKRPSEAQNDRIQEILEEAAEDNSLGFWIDEINHILGHKQGWLDDSCRREYELRKMELSSDALKFQRFLDKNNSTDLFRFVQFYLEERSKSKNGKCTA